MKSLILFKLYIFPWIDTIEGCQLKLWLSVVCLFIVYLCRRVTGNNVVKVSLVLGCRIPCPTTSLCCVDKSSNSPNSLFLECLAIYHLMNHWYQICKFENNRSSELPGEIECTPDISFHKTWIYCEPLVVCHLQFPSISLSLLDFFFFPFILSLFFIFLFSFLFLLSFQHSFVSFISF